MDMAQISSINNSQSTTQVIFGLFGNPLLAAAFIRDQKLPVAPFIATRWSLNSILMMAFPLHCT